MGFRADVRTNHTFGGRWHYIGGEKSLHKSTTHEAETALMITVAKLSKNNSKRALQSSSKRAEKIMRLLPEYSSPVNNAARK